MTLSFVFQAEDGIRDLVRSRGLGDVYKRQIPYTPEELVEIANKEFEWCITEFKKASREMGYGDCLLYTSDAADERSSVDLGGRRIIKKKKRDEH